MSPYIFMERKGIHIIDLNKTKSELEKAGQAARAMARAGKKILFVATKKQAKDVVFSVANRINMPFVTERWLGGMLTNFSTIRKSVKKMQSTERMLEDGTLSNVTKKERLMLTREKDKMKRVLGGIASLNRIPSAIFIVDISHEHLALAESKKLGIRTFGMVDTNSDPTSVDFAIPANDDASKSIALITEYMAECIKEGLNERKQNREMEASSDANEGSGERRPARTRNRRRKGGAAETKNVETPKTEEKPEAPVVEEATPPPTVEEPTTTAPETPAATDEGGDKTEA